jgi:hypothetical protein
MKINLLHKAAYSLFILLTIIAFTGCGNESSNKYSADPGAVKEIDEKDYLVVFEASGGWPDVTFTHKDHADYYEDDCFKCHSHVNVRDESVWTCSSCHSSDDWEGLCKDDESEHDCMYVQCLNCHEQLDQDPTPDCTSCHVTINIGYGQFLDGPVEGLIYWTSTQKGMTDSNGTFKYIPGEQITFAIGDIIIGTGVAQPIMTPVDLVPGAIDVTDSTVTNICRFLQTLDENGNHDDGINIPGAVLNEARNRTIPFTADPAVFENNSDLLGLLDALNSAQIFSDGNHSLISAEEAQANCWSLFNVPPRANNLGVNGNLFVNQTVMGKYTYSDADGDSEKGSTYQWYRADNVMGSNEVKIPGATSINYLITNRDMDKYLIFEVTPAAATGASPGTAVKSKAYGPVTSAPLPPPPPMPSECGHHYSADCNDSCHRGRHQKDYSYCNQYY